MSTNAIFDGKSVRLDGARGEYVSFQLALEFYDGGSNPVQVGTGVFASAVSTDFSPNFFSQTVLC